MLPSTLTLTLTQVARDASGGGYLLFPRIRLANHSCEPNTEVAHFPNAFACCACGLGHYVLRATRPIRAGEEVGEP